MGDEAVAEFRGKVSPGAMLKAARESRDITQREAADSLNWMPGYVAIMERDDYAALRRPSFARGYVKAFGRLVELEEKTLMSAFESLENRGEIISDKSNKDTHWAFHRQKTGLGVLVGLSGLSILIAALWWWQGKL